MFIMKRLTQRPDYNASCHPHDVLLKEQVNVIKGHLFLFMLTNELMMAVQLWPHRGNAPRLSPGKERSEWPLLFPGLCHRELCMSQLASCSRYLVDLCF